MSTPAGAGPGASIITSKQFAASFYDEPSHSLQTLPTELIEHITSFLPGFIPTVQEVAEPPHDIFNLRLVCRDLEGKLRYWFVYKHVLSKDSEFCQKGRIFVEPHYESFRTFHHLTAIEPIAKTIRSLFVNTMALNEDRLSRCIESLGKTQDMFLEWEENLPILAKRDTRLVDSVAKDVAQIRSRCYRCYYDQQWMFASKEDRKLLDEALSRVGSLKELQICSHDYSYLWSTTGGIGFIRDYTGIFKDAITTADNESLDHRTATLLSLVVKNNVSVKKLIVSHSEGVAAWVLDVPTHHFRQMDTTKLLVRLSNGEKRSDAPEGWESQKGYDTFLRILTALSSKLRALSFAPADSTFFDPSFVSRVLRCCPTTLTKLHLYDLVVRPQDLSRLLASLRPSLKRLSLSKLHLIEASWQRVVRYILLDELDHFPHLRRLRLGPSYDLQKEGYYCIEFPRAEERRGYEYQREGHWADGFWFCPVDSRYSVDVVGAAAGAGSEAAGGLRAALVEVLATAVSVRCEYDQVADWPCDFKHIDAKTATWAKDFFGGNAKLDTAVAEEP
ncbi:hypothetical protein HDK90DRAFT_462840 [Phyllosticta capitalensis]|uniref:F-box domain-containing protein n=1 Tax=Phyllosticta capitalensis TaxID=121624 RepID=A0ABR1YZ32_9PEZI